MKTIAEWNAEQKKKWKPEPLPALSMPEPKPMGAKCECGGRLMQDLGTFWGSGPFYQGVRCDKCGRKGYVDGWMTAPQIVLIEPTLKDKERTKP